jgi:hypothetical protein
MSAYKHKLLSIESNDLIGYWVLDESLGKTVEDASGHDRDGTASGVSWGQDGIGDGPTCGQFDGLNDTINLYNTSLRDAFDGSQGTLLAWVKVADAGVWTDGVVHPIARLAADANNQVMLSKKSTNNTLEFTYQAEGTAKTVQKSAVSAAGWLCLVITWDKTADQVKAYYNGSHEGATQTGLGTWAGMLASETTVIGADTILVGGGSSALLWQGLIAHVALWKKALTAEQIGALAKLYLMPNPVFSEMALGLPLLRGAGQTAWTVAIDWERNGNFTDAYNDVTDRVVEAQWFLGFRQPYQDAADNSVMSLTLKNHDRRFSPEYSDSPLAGKVVPFRTVRIQSSDGLVTRTHWQGWVESIQPAVNQFGQRLVQIVATGAMQFLKAAETDLELQENKSTDEVIDELIQQVIFPPALTATWVMGRLGNSELGQTTFLGGVYKDLDQGTLSFEMIGDNWVRQGGFSDAKQDTFNVYHAIQDVTAAERGRFFFDREGKAIFWNRHHLLRGGAPAALFDDTMTDMAYVYAGLEQMKNEIVVTCHPREISASDQEVLWELEGSTIRVEKKEPRTLFVKYKDDNGNRVGGKDVTVLGLEFEEGNAAATIDAKATGAELTFTNAHLRPATVKACLVRGRKIVDFDSQDAKAVDSASFADYGRRTLRINLPVIDKLDLAEHIAQFERTRRSQPHGAVSTIKLISHGKQGGSHHQQQLALTLGDKVAIAEAQTAHGAEHYIVGESHKLTAGGALFETTWYLEPAPEQYLWKLGVEGRSEVGISTLLRF